MVPVRLEDIDEESGSAGVSLESPLSDKDRTLSKEDLQLSTNSLKWEQRREKLKQKRDEKVAQAELRTMHLQELRQRLHEKFTRYQFGMTTLFLMMAGITTALIGAVIDLIINKGFFWVRGRILTVPGFWFGNYLLWLLFLGCTLWIGVTATLRLSPTASGSGIPEMKTILSGSGLGQFLSFKTLLVKAFGLTCAVGSGASLGKVGPFVHIGGLVVNNLAQLPPFEKIKKNAPLMQQMLGVGCAIGYACSLGTPIAGVLLSIEVTTSYYAVRNYWFTYVGTISASCTSETCSLEIRD